MNYLLLIPLVVLFMVLVVAVVVTACCCTRRRRRRKNFKTSSMQCSNPFSDQNDYGMVPTVRDGGGPQSNTKDSNVKPAVPKVPPIEHQSHLCCTSGASRAAEGKECSTSK